MIFLCVLLAALGGVALGYCFSWLATQREILDLSNALHESRSLVELEIERTERRRRFAECAQDLMDTKEALGSAHAALSLLRKTRGMS